LLCTVTPKGPPSMASLPVRTALLSCVGPEGYLALEPHLTTPAPSHYCRIMKHEPQYMLGKQLILAEHTKSCTLHHARVHYDTQAAACCCRCRLTGWCFLLAVWCLSQVVQRAWQVCSHRYPMPAQPGKLDLQQCLGNLRISRNPSNNIKHS
jgi:hypothetical protein